MPCLNRFILMFGIMMQIASCAHSLGVRSDPAGASVFSMTAAGTRGPLLGQTPLEIAKPDPRGFYSLEVAKEGHISQRILAPSMSSGNLEITVKLQPVDESFFKERYRRELAGALNESFKDLLKLQSAVIAKNAREVELLEKSLQGTLSDVSLFHSLLGYYQFMKGDRAEARKRYEKALSLDPSNQEAQAMLRLLARKGG